MAIDFPNSPTTNQTYTVGGTTWTYDGEKWVITATGLSGPQGATGATGATGPTGPEGGTSTLTTKGDLLTRTASAVARQGVGNNNEVLVADSSLTNGIKWATVSEANVASADKTGTNKIVLDTSPTIATSIISSGASFDVFNTTSTTINAFGAATTLAIGASSGTLTIGNATVTATNATTLNINGASPSIITTSTGTASVFNTNALTGSIFGAANTINIGNTITSALTLNIGTASTGASTYNIGTGATATATTKSINLGTGGASGSTTNIGIGSSNGGTTTVNSPTLSVSGNLTVSGSMNSLSSVSSSGDYPLALSDANKIIEFTSGSTSTVRVPGSRIAYQVGTSITIAQYGAGQVTIASANTSGLVATLSTGTAVVTLTTGTTDGLVIGQTLTKTSGTGAFGASATVASIQSSTQFTASINHATAGSTTFSTTGVTLRSSTGTKTRTTYSFATLIKRSDGEWWVMGDTTP